jgi:hypothetical protein
MGIEEGWVRIAGWTMKSMAGVERLPRTSEFNGCDKLFRQIEPQNPAGSLEHSRTF